MENCAGPWTLMGPEMSNTTLPKMVFERGSVVLPAMFPLAKLRTDGFGRASAGPQFMPLWTSSRSLVASSGPDILGCGDRSTIRLVNFGKRAESMGSASAQEAQKAAGAIRLADRRPKPPSRIGNVASSCADSFSAFPKTLSIVLRMPKSCPTEYRAD